MARKRAPGGGRKPSPSTPRAQLTVRMPDDMRAQLGGAAQKRGWTLTDELMWRLRNSFNRERDEKRDPPSRALCYLLAQTIATASYNVRDRDWRSDPFTFRTIKLAFDEIMDALAPRGEIRPPEPPEEDPENPEDPESRDMYWWFVPGTSAFRALRQETPEDAADFTAKVILRELAAPREPQSDEKRQDFQYAMSAARRDLAIKLKKGD
jgi:hypothetical protein